MNLFEIKNNKLVFSAEAIAIAPFKVLYDKDKTKTKEVATAELAAIYYFVDYKSDFSNILEETAKLKEIISILPDLGKDWKPYIEWNLAVDFYKKMQETPSMKLINSAKSAIGKLEKFFNTVDLMQVDKSGKPKYSPKQLGDTIAMMPKLIDSISALEEKIKKEIEQKNNKLRGGRDKGAFAD
jgi:hypothetical protein